MIPLFASLFILTGACAVDGEGILCPPDAPALVKLAAKEVRRYVYLRTGVLLEIGPDVRQPGIEFMVEQSLGGQEYRLRTTDQKLTISGGTPLAALYGAYAFAEKLGIRFQLDGDIIPDGRIPFSLPTLDETHRPDFEIRGIQPFHDFNEGPDFWNADDYKACVGQLVRMRMNFIGFHCYPLFKPWTHVPPEPGVWVGLGGDFTRDGRVTKSYPASWANTARKGWGYVPMKTSDFSFGAADLFENDDFGSDIMNGLMPEPKEEEDCNELFNRVGGLWRDTFTLARSRGVKTAIGTEVPLIIPDAVAARLRAQGKKPEECAGEIYEAIFRRIQATHPLDYFWFWTPERKLDKEQTKLDLLNAVEAHRKVAPDFQLAACGWGWIAENFPMLDQALPGKMPFSCINDEVGFAPVPDAFSKLGDRPRWSISWMEDDTAMTVPQLWAGRIRKDAMDARRYGCSGLMGIHWRTNVLSPNLAMLAESGWHVPAGKEPLRSITRTPKWIAHHRFDDRQCETSEFYKSWCAPRFGNSASGEIAAIMARMDGDLPREQVDWLNDKLGGSPGCLGAPDPRPWNEVKVGYSFVDELEALRPRISGAGNLVRFDYWLSQFRFFRGMGETCCAMGELDLRMKRLAEADESARRAALDSALVSRRKLLESWQRMTTHLLEAVNTAGELGTVTNLEQHSLHGHDMLTKHDAELERRLGQKLPADLLPGKSYSGKPRLIVPTVRGDVARGECLRLKVISLGQGSAGNLVAKWRPLGEGAWRTLPAKHAARGVWQVVFPAAEGDFEYHIESTGGGHTLRWPVTAPDIGRSVIVTD